MVYPEDSPQKQGGSSPGATQGTPTINADGSVTGTPVTGAAAAASGGASSSGPVVPYDPKAATGHVGLYNLGATCYMNSLLQTFFGLSYFREAVYRMTTESDGLNEIPKALQNLFFQMQERQTTVSTKCLTDAFGWSERDLFVQHDIQELAAKLRDCLEVKMKGTPAEGAINRMFTGYGEQVTKTLDGSYTSSRKDQFYDIHLPVQNYKTMEESLRSLVQKDKLVGDNKYKIEEEGRPVEYKDAEMGYQYTRFPPCVLFHLKRFEMDMMSPTLEMKKVNTEFQFPETVDLSEYENPNPDVVPPPLRPLTDVSPSKDDTRNDSDDTVSDAVYDLYSVIVHRGGVRSGHYYAFIRDWDAEKKQWTRWLLYDDDDVREVTPEQAIKGNFGGPVYHYVNGRQIASMATNSAYVLAYIRRSEISKLIYPIGTEAIPKHVKVEFQRVLEEDERRQKEEAERNRMINLSFITDETIRIHVNREIYELLPTQPRPENFAFAFSVKKTDPAVILKQEMTRRGLGDVRLWRLGITVQNGNPRLESVLPMLDQLSPQEPVSTLFQDRHNQTEDSQKAWSEVLYVERKSIVIPPLRTDVARLALKSIESSPLQPNAALPEGSPQLTIQGAFSSGSTIRLDGRGNDANPYVKLVFNKTYPLVSTSFRVQTSRSAMGETNISVAVYDKEDARPGDTPILHRRHRISPSSQSTTNFVSLPLFEDQKPTNGKCIIIRRYTEQGRSPMTITFALSRICVHTQHDALPNHQLPMPKAPSFPEYDPKESQPIMLKLFNHKTRSISYVGMTVLDKNEIFRNYNPRFLAMMNVGDRTMPLQFWDETRPYPIAHLQEDMNSTQYEGNLISGNIITVQQHSSLIPLVFRFTQADQYYSYIDNSRTVTLRRYDRPNDVAFVGRLQGDWGFGEIVDYIGEMMNIDPDRLRLYGSTGYHTVTPKADPERSDTKSTLDQMLQHGQWSTSDLFFEVLNCTIHEIEAQLMFSVKLCDVMGEPFGPDYHISLPIRSTVKSIVAEAVRQAKADPEASKSEYLSRGNTHWVFMERGSHIIYTYEAVDLAEKLDESSELESVRRNHTYEVRVFIPAGEGEKVTPCGHGDQSMNSPYQPHGMPFLLNIPEDAKYEEALSLLVDATKVPREELAKEMQLMIYTYAMMSLPDPNIALWSYINGTERSRSHPTHALLNHKRPKEKPGSRYVAMHEPQLVLEKKKANSKSTDNLGTTASAAASSI